MVKTPVSELEGAYRKRLGAAIVQLRAINGLSQALLAERLERSEAALSRWETGKATPTAFDLRRMAEVFGLEQGTVDLLVFPPDGPTSPVAERLQALEVKQPRPTLVPTASERELATFVEQAGVTEAVRRDQRRGAEAPATRPPSRKPPAPAK